MSTLENLKACDGTNCGGCDVYDSDTCYWDGDDEYDDEYDNYGYF